MAVTIALSRPPSRACAQRSRARAKPRQSQRTPIKFIASRVYVSETLPVRRNSLSIDEVFGAHLRR